MATGAANLIAFEMALDLRNFAYIELKDSTIPSLRISFNLDNIDQLVIVFWFDTDGESVHYATGTIAHVPKDKTDVALKAINEANLLYRWVTFCLDAESNITCSGDQMLIPDIVGDTCNFILSRTISICDEAYKSFMHALWAS